MSHKTPVKNVPRNQNKPKTQRSNQQELPPAEDELESAGEALLREFHPPWGSLHRRERETSLRKVRVSKMIFSVR